MEGKKGDGSSIVKAGRFIPLRRVDDVQSPTGGLKVQLQDETGRAFAGFGAEDCEPIVEDALYAPVCWRGSGDVRSLIGKMVALQFSFSSEDKLYSYTLRAEG